MFLRYLQQLFDVFCSLYYVNLVSKYMVSLCISTRYIVVSVTYVNIIHRIMLLLLFSCRQVVMVNHFILISGIFLPAGLKIAAKPRRILHRILLLKALFRCLTAYINYVIFYTNKGCDEDTRKSKIPREEAARWKASVTLLFAIPLLSHGEEMPHRVRPLKRQWVTA